MIFISPSSLEVLYSCGSLTAYFYLSTFWTLNGFYSLNCFANSSSSSQIGSLSICTLLSLKSDVFSIKSSSSSGVTSSLGLDSGLNDWLPWTLGEASRTKSSGSSYSGDSLSSQSDLIASSAKLAVSLCSFSQSSEKRCLSFSSEKMHSFKCRREVFYIWLFTCNFLLFCFFWFIFALNNFRVVFKKRSDLLLDEDDSWSSSFWFPFVLINYGLHKVVDINWGDDMPFEDLALLKVKAVRRSIWLIPPNCSTMNESFSIIFSCYYISCASLYECSQFFSATWMGFILLWTCSGLTSVS